jgi:hypothetical protein
MSLPRAIRATSGPVEGHVNRIKMIKRQMYGRANFDLLRRRILAPILSATIMESVPESISESAPHESTQRPTSR